MGAVLGQGTELGKDFTLAVTAVLTSLLTGKAQMLQEHTMPSPKEQMTKIKVIFHLRDHGISSQRH